MLRVQMVVPSDSAKEGGLYIPKNYRVPEVSIINRVHEGIQEYGVASECLSLWETSDGKRLPALPIRVEARKSFDAVLALLSPTGGSPHASRCKKERPLGDAHDPANRF